jgi:dTDP-4-amino-4,6-dideoxyglucose
MASNDLPAILGGTPLSERPLHIVRPCFPKLETFADNFRVALLSGNVTNHGKHVQHFESLLARYMHLSSVAVCNNGETALMLMLRAAGIDSGEVIVPSYTFSGTPHAVRWCGASPVFADIDPQTLCLDPQDTERRITPRTRAILGVDVYGIACDYAGLDDIGRRHGLPVLYDSAPAFGTRVDGRPIGEFGEAQIFSFHATKAFTTMEGGCVTSRNKRLVERVSQLRNFGQLNGPDCSEPGVNAKMPEVSALIGIEALHDFDKVVEHRNQVAAHFRESLSQISGLSFAAPPSNQKPVWLYFPVVVNPERFGVDRDILTEAMAAENLFVRKYFDLPCHHMKAYSSQAAVSLPVTESVAYNVVSLPIYNNMTGQEADLFVEGISRTHRNAGQVLHALSPSHKQYTARAL